MAGTPWGLGACACSPYPLLLPVTSASSADYLMPGGPGLRKEKQSSGYLGPGLLSCTTAIIWETCSSSLIVDPAVLFPRDHLLLLCLCAASPLPTQPTFPTYFRIYNYVSAQVRIQCYPGRPPTTCPANSPDAPP